MNTFRILGAGIVRFVLAGAAAATAQILANALLAPLNPFGGAADPAFFRLFLGQSMVVGNGLAFFIKKSRLYGLRLFGMTLLAYVGSAQLLAHVETVAFNFIFDFGPRELLYIVISQLASALLLVPLVMGVAGKWKASAIPAGGLAETGTFEAPAVTAGRLILPAVLWYFCYMTAGFLIADPLTHSYYAAKHPDLASINAWLPALQFFRGLGWTALVLLGLRIMNRPPEEGGLILGVLYGTFHAAGLLLPSPFMPAEMRLSHLPEIVVSLAMFCPAVTAVLTAGSRPKGARPRQAG